jgi:hypothetical protein
MKFHGKILLKMKYGNVQMKSLFLAEKKIKPLEKGRTLPVFQELDQGE